MQIPIRDRKLLSAPEGRKLIQPYLMALAKIPVQSWKFYREHYKSFEHLYSPTLRAGIIHAHMVDFAQKLELLENGIKYLNPYPKQHMLSIEKRALVRFKKMNEELHTSNIPTQIQEKLKRRQLDAFDEGNFRHLINVGYIPNSTWTEPEKIVITESYHSDDPEWVVSLSSNLEIISDSVGTVEMFEYEFEHTSQERDIEVKLKNNK